MIYDQTIGSNLQSTFVFLRIPAASILFLLPHYPFASSVSPSPPPQRLLLPPLLSSPPFNGVPFDRLQEISSLPQVGVESSRYSEQFPEPCHLLTPRSALRLQRAGAGYHQKHQQTYVTNYNKALEQLEEATNKGDAPAVVKLQSIIKFNGGGHINHSIFWQNLAPIREGGGEPPKGTLGWAVDEHFGSLKALVCKMNAEGAALQGSGRWLGLDKEFKKLVVETTTNQDPLVTKGPLVPLIGIDVWEHAYYLQYKNVRPDYLKNIWKVH